MKCPCKFGEYELINRLAVGGMAEIYVAKTAGLAGFEKHLVLKVIHPNYAKDPEFIAMLVEEAKLVVRLNHVNIAQVFDLGVEADRYYIAMEYVEGPDLYQLSQQLIRREEFIPFPVAAFITSELCSGLDYAHRRCDEQGSPLNIIHRDISPHNVLISYSGDVKIIDFGVAKARARSRNTEKGIIKGKFSYMSPEQANGRSIDHRSDIFSLGVLFYEVITNRKLYETDTTGDALKLAQAGRFLPPSIYRADISNSLEQIVLKALSRFPEDRYSTAQEMRIDLGNWLSLNEPGYERHRLAKYLKMLLKPREASQTQTMEREEFSSSPGSSVIFDFNMADSQDLQESRSPYRETREIEPLESEDKFGDEGTAVTQLVGPGPAEESEGEAHETIEHDSQSNSSHGEEELTEPTTRDLSPSDTAPGQVDEEQTVDVFDVQTVEVHSEGDTSELIEDEEDTVVSEFEEEDETVTTDNQDSGLESVLSGQIAQENEEISDDESSSEIDTGPVENTTGSSETDEPLEVNPVYQEEEEEEEEEEESTFVMPGGSSAIGSPPPVYQPRTVVPFRPVRQDTGTENRIATQEISPEQEHKQIFAVVSVLALLLVVALWFSQSILGEQGGAGEIRVESTPEGAQISLDGVETEWLTPYTLTGLDVEGRYDIGVQLEGFQAESVEGIRSGAEQAEVIQLELTPLGND